MACTCSDSHDYDIKALCIDTQILPKLLNENSMKIEERPDKMFLITYGKDSYGKKKCLKEILYPYSFRENENENNLVGIERDALESIRIKKLIFGNNHSLMLLELNKGKKTVLLGYGSNENGQLGLKYDDVHGHNYYDKWRVLVPDLKEVQKLEDYKILDIALGNDMSLILVELANQDKPSQLLIRLQLKEKDKFYRMSSMKNDFSSNITRTVNIEKIKFDKENEQIKQIGICMERTLVLTDANNVYLKGLSYDLQIIKNFIKLQSFSEEVVSMHLGFNVVLFLMKDNTINCIGHNEYGEFGCKFDRTATLTDVYSNTFFKEKNLNIKKISTGLRHALVLCDNEELYTFGDNSDGQCSGFDKVIFTPKKVEFDNEEKIVDIECGDNHSIAKTKKGQIFAWGDGENSKLGIEENKAAYNGFNEINDMKTYQVNSFYGGPIQSAFCVSEIE